MKNRDFVEKLSILMPMYNEAGVRENVDIVEDQMKKDKIPYEIILIDDGSTNDCLEEAKQTTSKKVKIVSYKKNMGKGHALVQGFKQATGSHIAFLDSDLELHPKILKQFIPYLKEHDIVVGSKRHPESKLHYPLSRKLLSRLTQLAVRVLFDLKVRDTQVGIKLFKRQVLDDLHEKLLVKKYAFDLELLVNANKRGYKIIERPVELNFKFSSGIKPKTIFWAFVDMMAILYRLKLIRYYDK